MSIETARAADKLLAIASNPNSGIPGQYRHRLLQMARDQGGTEKPPSGRRNPKLGMPPMEVPPAMGLTLDPVVGELHYDGGMRLLTRQQTRLLVVFMAAKGEAVSLEQIDDLTRGRVDYTDKGTRRRAMMHNLRECIRPLGLEIEHRGGFGYRLRGDIQFRAKPVEVQS